MKAYEHFFFHYTSSDLLIVNTSDIDFVDRNEDLQELLRKVTEPIKGTQYFLPLGGQEAVELEERRGPLVASRCSLAFLLLVSRKRIDGKPLSEVRECRIGSNQPRVALNRQFGGEGIGIA